MTARLVLAFTVEILIAAVFITYAARHRLRQHWAARRAQGRQDIQALRDIRGRRAGRLAEVADARIVLLAAAHELSATPDEATGVAAAGGRLMDETTVRMPLEAGPAEVQPDAPAEVGWPQPIPQDALNHLQLYYDYAGRHCAGEQR